MIFRYYEYFYKVALLGNITKAAKELYISQPALSKAMVNIENELGCTLFERSKKGVCLTLEGELLFQNVKQTFSLLNETKNNIESIKDQHSSIIRIGVGRDLFEKYMLAKLIQFTEKYPTARFRLQIAATNIIEKALESNLVDIGITPQPLNGNFSLKLDLFPLYDCFITGEKYKSLISEPHSIYQLANYPMIMLPKDSLSRVHADNIFSSFGLTANPIHELKDTQLISLLVQNNFGIGFVTENFVDHDIKTGLVYKVPVIEKFPSRMATLTWNAKIPLTSTAKALIQFLQDT
ncbi:MAG: LysR family transcriptional regulator [Christensenellales bacterium]|jgi:DNA-binding transcriptional LysR family regulator